MSRPRSGQNSIYRNEFLCYSNRRCDRPDRSHMTRPLTAPWGVQGSIVDETMGGPETCTNDFQYQEYPWNGVCSYLEIYNPGIYTFATPCKCGTETAAPADLNERLCIWQGERCGGTIIRTAPPPSSRAVAPPPGGWYGPANATGDGLNSGAVTGIVLGAVGCAAIMGACAAYAWSMRAARAGARVAQAAIAAPTSDLPPLMLDTKM